MEDGVTETGAAHTGRASPTYHGKLFIRSCLYSFKRDGTNMNNESGSRSTGWYRKKKVDKPLGICTRYPYCHEVPDGGYKMCHYHREQSRLGAVKFRTKPKEVGVCRVPHCKNQARHGLTRCEKCSASESMLSKKPSYKDGRAKIRQVNKAKVINAYGSKCICCGVSDLAFLTIDHVNRYNGVGPRGGNPLYLWIIKNNFPPDFRILCMNCNHSLGHFGYCPHSDLLQPLKDTQVSDRTIKVRPYAKNRNFTHKIAAFAAYGGVVCKCCGESNHECLSVDHIDGGGTAHRKELNGTPIYMWLRKNNYPSGFQVLCMNCNCSKRITGTCWHNSHTDGVD